MVTCVIEVLLEVVLVICDTKVTSADELIMKGVDLMLSPKRMGAVIVAFFAATCITGTGNMVINSNVQIVLWWLVLIIPNIVGAVATFAYFVSGKKSKIYSIMIYLVTIWGMFRIIYSNYNLIVHANQYLSMNSTVRLVLEVAIHCLVIYQTYVLYNYEPVDRTPGIVLLFEHNYDHVRYNTVLFQPVLQKWFFFLWS